MKIVKGPDGSWKQQYACGNCDSLLEVEASDLRYGKFYSGMDADVSFEFYFTCPTCEHTVFVNEAALPNSVKFIASKGKYLS